ncbi:MAG TPA: LLM class flavin-dependent oxidoreductase [Dehalococcoidia bacterium]|nr:LLM class flavin-dependent oxidoreductase [Dehalococcoidia bacterium]
MDQTGFFLNASRETADEDVISMAQLADDLGYHSFWTSESWGRDAFTVLTMVACHTQNLRLGTGIVTVYSRTPAMIAQTVASLDILSKGRAILGLGSSGKVVIENWHGVPFESPLARTGEYIDTIRKALSGEVVTHHGKFHQMDRFRLMSPPLQERLPIYVASLGPRNLALTGEKADGWLPIWTNRERLPDLKEQIAQGAAKAGRGISDVTAAPYIMCYAAQDDEDTAHGAQLLRAHMAYYIGGMGSYYFDSFSRAGFANEAQAVKSAWGSGDRQKAADSVSDKMLESVTVLGTPQQCRDQMAAFRRAGADLPIVNFPRGASLDTARRTIEALAPGAESK